MREGVNRVALRLFEHNEKAYRAAVRMMEQYGKAAIVRPTGTGKSFIAFKLIEDNPEATVLWLSPSEYIFKTQLESLKRNDPDFPLVNVHFYTYAKLLCCTQEQLDEIAAQKSAYIILDEFHCAGAECWGESTVALLKLCPDAKLLGLTATNICYLDNNRDMAEELTNGHIASEMTLGEAVVRGILPTPKYVTTVYQYQKTLAKYQERVDNLRTPGIQDTNQKYHDTHRNLMVPGKYTDPEGYPLGQWIIKTRQQRLNDRLKEERITQLDEIGMVWSVFDVKWEKADSRPRRLELAQEPKRENRDLNVSANHKTGKDIGLCS